MKEIQTTEMSFPVVLYAKDGWIEVYRSGESLTMWSIGSLRRYLEMGLYFLDSDGQAWVVMDFSVNRKPTIKNTISMILMGIPPLSDVTLRLTRIPEDGVSKFKSLILSDPPKKRVRFTPKEIESICKSRHIGDFMKIMKDAGVPVSR